MLSAETVIAELFKPTPNLQPQEVVSIQLNALKDNNNPYENAGIEQTWEFAHPSNRIFTGPLKKFTTMMYSPSYFIMLEHKGLYWSKLTGTESARCIEPSKDYILPLGKGRVVLQADKQRIQSGNGLAA